MKIKPVHLFCAVFAILTLTACPNKEPIPPVPEFNDPDKEEAVYSIVWGNLLSPSFRIIELAEVFSGYQEIRSEREKALRYVDSYFSTRSNIYYEFMDINFWGRIDLMPDGSFTVMPDIRRFYWIANNMPLEVVVKSPEKHTYISSSTSGNDPVWDITASVEDYMITMTDLDIRFKREFRLIEHSVEMKVLEPLTMPICSKGVYKMEPVSGKISIRYKSSEADRTFKVEFNEEGKTFILANGKTREAGPEVSERHYEY